MRKRGRRGASALDTSTVPAIRPISGRSCNARGEVGARAVNDTMVVRTTVRLRDIALGTSRRRGMSGSSKYRRDLAVWARGGLESALEKTDGRAKTQKTQ